MERTIVGSWLRTTQAWCQQLCEKETLDHGIVYFHRRLAVLPEACQLREVVLPDSGSFTEAFQQTEAWFAQRGLKCHKWAPAEGQEIEPLDRVLRDHGFARRDFQVMSLARWVELSPPGGIRVVPARAMRTALGDAIRASEEPAFAHRAELLAEAYAERLDDAHLDMFVALSDRRPVGAGGLFQVGDVARVVTPFVTPGPNAGSTERALLAAALGLARRLTLRTILTHIEKGDDHARQRLDACGFVVAGEVSEFERAEG